MIRRLLSIVIITGILVALAVWLAERPGSVTLRWEGWRIDTSVPVLLLIVIGFYVALAVIWKLVRGTLNAPGRFLNYRKTQREKAGYRALADGMAAIAAGDSHKAKRLSAQAEKKLRDPSVTALLTAQSAQLSGNTAEAEIKFKAMTERPETALAGYKGLMTLAHQSGDDSTALVYAERAWDLNIKSDGLALAYFELCAKTNNWDKAEAMLREAKRRKSFNGGDWTRRLALVRTEQAKLALNNTLPKQAADLALDAHKTDPGCVPAAIQAARALAQTAQVSKAHKILAKTYSLSAHPDLLIEDLALEVGESPLNQVKRLEKLVKGNPEPVDGHIVLADTAMAAKLWGLARTHLELATTQRPSAGVFTRLARLEREERQDEAKAQTWIAQAAQAPADPAWLCCRCHNIAAIWQPVCTHCGAVDALDWAQPPRAQITAA